MLKRAVAKAAEMGYIYNVGPECEFFLFHKDAAGDPTTAFLAALRRGNALLRTGTPAEALAAAAKVRDAGWKHFDFLTPFPIHGMEEAMGQKRSWIPYVTAVLAFVGIVLAQAPGGLTCFLLPRVLDDGERNPIRIQRLKDKLGNRSNASSEIELDRIEFTQGMDITFVTTAETDEQRRELAQRRRRVSRRPMKAKDGSAS